MHGVTLRLLYTRHYRPAPELCVCQTTAPYSVNTVASASSELTAVPAILPLSLFQPSFDTQSCWVPQAKRGLSGDPTPLQVLISCLGLDGRWVLEHFFLRAVGWGVQPLRFETVGACRASLPDFADRWGRTLKKCKAVCNCGGGIPNESRTSGHRNCKAERC